MSDQLVLLDEARARLAKVASVDDAKKIRDQAAAMEHYARQQKGALDAANKASEIKVRAERRIGELLKAVPRVDPKERASRGGVAKAEASARPHHGDKHGFAEVVKPKTKLAQTIERAEITPRMAEDCQKLAAIPAPMFEAAIVTMQQDPEVAHRGVSTAGMLRVYRDSDGSIESIKKAVNKEVAALPATRFAAVLAKFGKALVELEELSADAAFVGWVHASKTETIALREAFKAARGIEKEIFA